jgi:hypothetical protein
VRRQPSRRKLPLEVLAALCAGALVLAGPPAGAEEEAEEAAEPAAEAAEATSGAADAVPPAPSPAAAEMLKSMREKGILSEHEFEDIYRRQAIYEHEEREKEKAPPWFRDWTVGGDVRIRLERIDRGDLELSRVIPPSQQGLEKDLVRGEDNVDFLNNTAEGIRDRMRLRFRLGAERRLGENWTIGFRIATAQELDLTTDYGNASSTTAAATSPWATTSRPRVSISTAPTSSSTPRSRRRCGSWRASSRTPSAASICPTTAWSGTRTSSPRARRSATASTSCPRPGGPRRTSASWCSRRSDR